MKNIQMKKKLAFLSMVLLAIILICIPFHTAEAATIKLNKTAMQLAPKQNYTLKVLNTKKKAKWSSSNSKVVGVNSKGKVTAKKAGTAVITAKIGSKKYSCKIIVMSKNKVYPVWKKNQVFLGKLVEETWWHPSMGKQTAYILKLVKPIKYKSNEGEICTISEIHVFSGSASKYINKYVFVKGYTVSQYTQYYRRALSVTETTIF